MSQQIYLNTASCGLITPATLEASNKLYADFATNSSYYSEQWAVNNEARIRQTVADFIGAPVSNTALVPNFSWAMNAVVQSLKGTERVLLYRNDFPSLLEPFRTNGFPITWVDAPDGFHIDMEAVREAITSNNVDIVALSHVQWTSGYTLDLRAVSDLCREHGVRFFADVTQSMGAHDIHARELGLDVMAGSNYKWMNAGFGTGILYVADSFLARYPPVVGGFHTMMVRQNSSANGAVAAAYEPGSPNMFGLSLLEAAILEKNKTGLANIQRDNYALAQLFLDSIKDLPLKILGDYTMNNRCSIVLLHDENGLGEWIAQHNIVVTRRNGMLRVSMHFYNTAEDVMALVTCLKDRFS